MKFLVKLILIILLIPIGIITIIASTAKFDLLNPTFWQNAFKKNNVYVNLSVDIKNFVEDHSARGGGKISDLKSLTDIITPAIIEDFTVHNLDNFIGFANGNKKELLVYIPINKIPKEFAPKSEVLNNEEIPLGVLLSKFNVTTGQDLPISQIAFLGLSINYILIGSVALSVIFILLLFLLTKEGGRFISIAIYLFLTGILTLLLSKILISIRHGSPIILKTVIPPILTEISKTWSVVGIVLICIGIICCFLKKPNETRQI